MDRFLSKLKYLIGFYQVTHGLLNVFSYIRWPDSLDIVARYSGILQLNLFQIAPIRCLFPGLKVNAFGELLLILSLNAIAVTTSGVVYGIRRRIIFGKKHLEDEQKRAKTSHMKEIVYKNLFFILYITYLSTFSKTASVLPSACREICRDKNEDLCKTYLKAGYSVKCQVQTYKHLLVLAYISTAYIFTLPTATFIALWRHRRAISSGADGKGVGVGREIFEGLRFLSDNYEPRTWYWELVEMSGKIVLGYRCGEQNHSREYI